MLGDQAQPVPPPEPHPSKRNAKQQKRPLKVMYKECKQCQMPSEMKQNQVYCTANNCKKIVNNAENHAIRQHELEFFQELKNADDPANFRKYIWAYKRATGGGAPGKGNRQSGSFDVARLAMHTPYTNA